jgi:hypothetical protein
MSRELERRLGLLEDRAKQRTTASMPSLSDWYGKGRPVSRAGFGLPIVAWYDDEETDHA